MTIEVTICQMYQGQFKSNAYGENWKCIVFTVHYIQVAPILRFNTQNASPQFYPWNIEETVARLPVSGILGKLQELYGKETEQLYSFKM